MFFGLLLLGQKQRIYIIRMNPQGSSPLRLVKWSPSPTFNAHQSFAICIKAKHSKPLQRRENKHSSLPFCFQVSLTWVQQTAFFGTSLNSPTASSPKGTCFHFWKISLERKIFSHIWKDFNLPVTDHSSWIHAPHTKVALWTTFGLQWSFKHVFQ